MQFVNRKSGQVPLCFTGEGAIRDRLSLANFFKEDEDFLAQNLPPSSEFELDGSEVFEVLLELFKGKCAFCESRGGVNIGLFRPTEEAQPLASSKHAHLYYVWLRSDWNNHYPICSDCGSASKGLFPVRNLERGRLPTSEELTSFATTEKFSFDWPPNDKSLLLDPCDPQSNFSKHFSFSISGKIYGLSVQGRTTIATYDLNRVSLVMAREKVFREYWSLLAQDLTTGAVSSALDFDHLEFGGGWYLLLQRSLTYAFRRLGRRVASLPKELPAAFAELWPMPMGREALEEGINNLIQVDKVIKKHSSVQENFPQITSIQIENFKAVENLTLSVGTPLAADSSLARYAEAGALLILGENAVGKSSILEAVALACTDAETRNALRVAASACILDPRLMGASKLKRPKVAKVVLGFSNGQEKRLEVGDNFDEQSIENLIPPVFAYGAFRQYSSRSPARTRKNHVASLFHSDILLPNPEIWLLKLPEDEFSMVIRALRFIFVVGEDFDVIKRDYENNRCLIVTRVSDGTREIITPFMSVSSGFRSVVAMVCDILAGLLALEKKGFRRKFGDIPALILIDEIEAHLHPRWKMQIMSALRQIFSSATIIATSHDPLCLRGLYNGEVAVLRQSPILTAIDDELPVRVELISDLPNVNSLTVEQLLTSDFFSMFSTDSVEAEMRFARMGDLLALQSTGTRLSTKDEELLQAMKDDVLSMMPLGSTEVQRIIQEAIFEFVRNRRKVSAAKLGSLKKATRDAIIEALEKY